MVQIDRSNPWFTIIGASANSALSVWENPLAQQISAIDFEDIELLPLIDDDIKTSSLDQKTFSEQVVKRLEEYKTKGYILLDGSVVMAMLRFPLSIPSIWSIMTDSDAFDESSASIRFDGSIFKFNGYGEELVPQPFTLRGHWGWGYSQRVPKIVKPNGERTICPRAYTAALKCENFKLRLRD